MLQRVLEPEVMDTLEEAQGYDAMDHSEPNTNFVNRLAELGAHGRMLDIGTGPAHIPVLVCQHTPGATVVGIDLSSHMLDIARRKIESANLADRIKLRIADAKGLPFEPASFDTVYSNTILHHIPDPRSFLAEARRVLRPAGVLLIRDLFRPPDNSRVEELVELHAATADEYQQQLFRQSLQAALTPDELRAIVFEMKWPDVEVVIDTDRHMSLQTRRRPR